jgi:hypothetical protein
MRDKLNSNPVAQAAVIGVLLLGALFFVMSTMGGKEDPESEAGSTDSAAIEELAATGAPVLPAEAAASAPPPPRAVSQAFDANQTVVLLFVKDGAIDDELAVDAVGRLRGLVGVATFIVPASQIARYAAIAQGVALDRVPALVVIRPKRLAGGVPTASVQYGFQSPQSVVQAVIDAGYKGPTLEYHP